MAATPAAAIDPRRVQDSVHDIQRRIGALAGDRHVELIAVTKGFGPDAVDAAIAAGCSAIGENYAQELVAKVAERPATSARPEVHFIGHLQTNKVRHIAGIVDVWQTVDRPALVAEIVKRAPGARVFVQVNTTGEDSKGGCEPEGVDGLVEQCRVVGLHIEGLMTIGPTSGQRTATATAFSALREMADRNWLEGCSMGMSDDFELALEHGATHLRIGSALFGERPKRAPLIG